MCFLKAKATNLNRHTIRIGITNDIKRLQPVKRIEVIKSLIFSENTIRREDDISSSIKASSSVDRKRHFHGYVSNKSDRPFLANRIKKNGLLR